MSFSSLPIESFQLLRLEDHQLAVRIYDAEILQTLAYLGERADETEGPDHEKTLDELCCAINLRKVHKVRLEEMQEEQAATAAPDGPTLQAAA